MQKLAVVTDVSFFHYKVISLTEAHEPDIYNAIRDGALVVNTGFKDGSNEIDFACNKVTEM